MVSGQDDVVSGAVAHAKILYPQLNMSPEVPLNTKVVWIDLRRSIGGLAARPTFPQQYIAHTSSTAPHSMNLQETQYDSRAKDFD